MKITQLNPSQYFEAIRSQFLEHGDPEIAQQQMAYMKFHFEFFGMKATTWLPLTKKFHEKNGVPAGDDLLELVRICFADSRRELHYFGIETFQKTLKKQPAEAIEFFEELITTNSWWDSVDWLAKLVGQHFQRFPDQILPTTERWMATENMWLQRVCIIFQLFYRSKTDTELMFRYILRVAHSKEFFLQKAAGWALRQHSRTDAAAVRAFVESHSLAPLTRREALRLIN